MQENKAVRAFHRGSAQRQRTTAWTPPSLTRRSTTAPPSAFISFHPEGAEHAARLALAISHHTTIRPHPRGVPQGTMGPVFVAPYAATMQTAANSIAALPLDTLPTHISVGARVRHAQRGFGIVSDISSGHSPKPQKLGVLVTFEGGDTHRYYRNWHKLAPLDEAQPPKLTHHVGVRRTSRGFSFQGEVPEAVRQALAQAPSPPPSSSLAREICTARTSKSERISTTCDVAVKRGDTKPYA
jgi:hypothetical protein